MHHALIFCRPFPTVGLFLFLLASPNDCLQSLLLITMLYHPVPYCFRVADRSRIMPIVIGPLHVTVNHHLGAVAVAADFSISSCSQVIEQSESRSTPYSKLHLVSCSDTSQPCRLPPPAFLHDAQEDPSISGSHVEAEAWSLS